MIVKAPPWPRRVKAPPPHLPAREAGSLRMAPEGPPPNTYLVVISAMDTAGFEPSDVDAVLSLPVTDAGPSKRTSTNKAKANVNDMRRKNQQHSRGISARVCRRGPVQWDENGGTWHAVRGKGFQPYDDVSSMRRGQ